VSRLLAWKFRVFWRSVARRSGAAAAANLIVALLGILWTVAVFLGSRHLFARVALVMSRVPPEGGSTLAGMESLLLSGVYLLGLTICLFTAFGAAFVTMYSSSDLPLLFAAPLTVRQVFAVKFAEVLAAESLWVVLLILPATLGYGAGVGGAWWYYLMAFLLALIAVFLSGAVGTCLNLLAMRFIPPYRVKELGAALGSLLGAAFYVLSQLGPRYAAGMSPSELAKLMGRFPLANVGYSPAWWLAEAARTAAHGSVNDCLAWLGLVAACSLVFFMVSFVLVQEAFYGGWAGSGEVRRRERRRKAAARASRVPRSAARRGSPVLTLAAKEVRSIARDMREWAQALYLLVVMGMAWIVPAIRNGEIRFPAGGAGSYASLAAIYMMLAGLATYLALGAVGREGESWLLLRATPVSGQEILLGKVLGVTALLVIPGLVLALGLGLALGGGSRAALLAGAFALVVAPGITSLNVGAGALRPVFSARDPRKRISSGALLLSLALEAGYAAVLAAGVWMMAAGSAMGIWIRIVGLVTVLGSSACAAAAPVVLVGRYLDARESVVSNP